MEIITRDFGPIEIGADAVYEFPDGIYGFEEDRRFAVFQQAVEDIPFLFLQSLDHPAPCFFVFEPWDLYPGYEPQMSREDLDLCQAEHVDELIFLSIASIPAAIRDLSINVKSPVVLNPRTAKGRQVILQNPDYTVRYRPFQEDGKEGA